MRKLLLIIIILLVGCSSTRSYSPTVLNRENLKDFWSYCTRCVTDNCEDVDICEKRMDRALLRTVFMDSLVREDYDAIRFSIETLKFSPNEIDERYHYTPLSISASYPGQKSEMIAKYLIEKGANVNQLVGGHARTPLLKAIWKKNNPVARYLLQNGADPTIKSDRGFDACIFAHRWSNYEIMPDLPGCCERFMKIKSDAALVEEKLRPPELVKYCKK